MVWVKFHDALCAGAKRGLPRAVRFIYMELCLEARSGRGVMDLPVGMNDVDALHDVLGGNRKEIVDALAKLTVVPEPTPSDPNPRAMIELTGKEGARRLTIPAWDRWNTGQEAPGASTSRSRRHRQQRARNDTAADSQTDGGDAGNDDATAMQRPLHPIGNDDATTYRGEEIREEEKREEEKSHTHRAHVREDDEDEDDGLMPAPTFTREDLAVLLREIPALVPVADDATELDELYQGFRIACGDAATEALARTAIGTLLAREHLGEMVVRQRRERAGTYLANARRYSRTTDRGSETRSVSPDARVVLQVFGDVWAAKKRRAFVQASGDEKHATALVEQAWKHAGELKMRPRDLVRFWAEKHLACADKWVVESDHALRTLGSQLTSYGLPRPAPPKAEPREPAPPGPATVPFQPLEMPAGLVEALGRPGAGYDGTPPPRPGASR